MNLNLDLDLDTKFGENLDFHIKTLIRLISNVSGRYSVNTEKSIKWINSQKSELRINTARDFIASINYISIQEYVNGIEHLILESYNKINMDGKIYMYVGEPNKSYYFGAIVAMYIIKKHQLRQPDYFLKTINEDLSSITGNDPVILVDDMAYSGSQHGTLLSKIYLASLPGSSSPNIYLFLYGLNSISHRKLSEVQTKKKYTYAPSPFKILYYRIFPLLSEQFGIARAFFLCYFFSPHTSGYPLVNVYFDHKIADDVSTFAKGLAYGPIIPNSFVYDTLSDDDEPQSSILWYDCCRLAGMKPHTWSVEWPAVQLQL